MPLIKKYVLLVEDDKDFRTILAERLGDNGYQVISCGKASEATRILRNQNFICILLDLQLEDGSGKSIVDSLRFDSSNINYSTPIFITSGQVTPEVVRCLKGQVSGVLVKPFGFEQLFDRIKSVTDISN